MRFDSFKSFISLLEALGSLGYQVPFKDYEQDFKNKGFGMHIHFYKFNLLVHDNLDITISTTDLYGNYWSIKAVFTKDSIKNTLIKLLRRYVKFTPSIKEVNGSNYLINLIKEGIDNEKEGL